MTDLFGDDDTDNDLRKGVSVVDKVEALRREINYRRYVYPRRIQQGKMSRHAAQEQILIMEAILQDYLTNIT